jgi:hypothetical protein
MRRLATKHFLFPFLAPPAEERKKERKRRQISRRLGGTDIRVVFLGGQGRKGEERKWIPPPSLMLSIYPWRPYLTAPQQPFQRVGFFYLFQSGSARAPAGLHIISRQGTKNVRHTKTHFPTFNADPEKSYIFDPSPSITLKSVSQRTL